MTLQDILRSFAAAAGVGDSAAVKDVLGSLYSYAKSADVDERVEALSALAPVISTSNAEIASWVAVIAGAIVELGCPADEVASAVIERFRRAVGEAAATLALVVATNPEANARAATDGWGGLGNFLKALLTVLQCSAEARQSVADREALIHGLTVLARGLDEAVGGDDVSDRDAADPLRGPVGNLRFAIDLLRVLDDELVIVLHRSLRRGYQVRIGGIGDNFQLHTLVAHAVIGSKGDGLIPAERLDPAWVEVAGGGPAPKTVSNVSGMVRGLFNLVDANGEWIWNEGVPADIPIVSDRRLIVLDPPPYQRSWWNARRFPQMHAHLVLDQILTSEEVERWFSHVHPAVRGTP